MPNLINMLINQLKVTLRKRAQHLSFIREFRNVNVDEYEVGQEVTVDTFEAGDIIDVTGTSKGKGFQGAIKRHGQARGPMAHGSHFHRAPGSVGMASDLQEYSKAKNAWTYGWKYSYCSKLRSSSS